VHSSLTKKFINLFRNNLYDHLFLKIFFGLLSSSEPQHLILVLSVLNALLGVE